MLQALASMGLQRVRHDRATELTEGKARESTFLTSFQVMPTHFEEHYEKCTQISIAAGFLGGSVVKNLPANEGDEGSILQEDTLEKEMATHSSTLAWDTP